MINIEGEERGWTKRLEKEVNEVGEVGEVEERG